MIKKLLTIATLTLLLQGCSTGYKPDSISGGYTSVQLGENMYRINYYGNGFTGKEEAIDYALLRSAEVTLENGYKYFSIIKNNTHIDVVHKKTPIEYETTTIHHGHKRKTVVVKQTGGEHYTTEKPNTKNVIVCYKEKPEDKDVYDAEIIKNELKRLYELD